MKPRLKNSVHFAPVAEGVYFRGWKSSFVLKGTAALYQWVERLVPHLNGSHALEDIVGGLNEAQRKMIEQIISQLVQHEMVQDCAQELPHNLSEQELATFQSTLSFLADVRDSAGHFFEKFRTANILLIGSGHSFYAMVRALVTMGLAHVQYALRGEQTEDTDARIRRLLENRANQDARLHGQRVDVQFEQLSSYDMILHVSDVFDLAFCRDLSRASLRQQVPLLQGIVVEAGGLVGPLTKQAGDVHWESAWQRFSDAHSADALLLVDPQACSPALLALVGNGAAYEAFKLFTESLPLDTQGKVLYIEGNTLESQVHKVAHHPDSIGELAERGGLRALLAQFQARQEPVEVAAFLEAANDLFDSEFGIVNHLHPGDLMQVPHFCCEALVTRVGEGEHAKLVGFGTDLEDARYQTARKALETYAELHMARGAADSIQAVRCGSEDVVEMMPASSFAIATGHTYAEWLADGLQKALLQQIERDDVDKTVEELDMSSLTWEESRRELKTLALRFARDVNVYTITIKGVEAAKIVMVCEGDALLAAAAGRSLREVLHQALFAAVSHVQLGQAEHSASLAKAVSVRLLDESAEELIEWNQWNENIRQSLEAAGAAVWAAPWEKAPEIAAARLLVGRVGIC